MDLPFSRLSELTGKPEIIYPCRWEYRAIGSSEPRMRAAIARIFAELDYTLTYSHASRKGKYCSLLLTTMVRSELHRNELFAALSSHRDIRMVL